MLPNPHQLNSFLVAAQSQSFSAAAEKLYISHAALIQQINALEEALGFTLFIRSPKGIRLTESGAYFEKKLREIDLQIERLVRTCAEMERQNAVIRVGKPNDMDVFFFRADLFNSFTMTRRKYTLEYVQTSREHVLEDCQSQKIDVGYYFGPASHKEGYDLSYAPVSRGNMSVMMSSDHPLSGKNALTTDDLKNRTLYFNDISFSENLYEQMPHLRESILVPIYFSVETLYQKCLSGELILLPSEYVRLFPSLRCLPLSPAVDFVFELVYRPNASPPIRELIDYYTHYVSQST